MRHAYTRLNGFKTTDNFDKIADGVYCSFNNAITTSILVDGLPSGVSCNVKTIENNIADVDEKGIEACGCSDVTIHLIQYIFKIDATNKKDACTITNSLMNYFNRLIKTAYDASFKDNGFTWTPIPVEEDEYLIIIHRSSDAKIGCAIYIPCNNPICTEPNLEYFTTAKLEVFCNAINLDRV